MKQREDTADISLHVQLCVGAVSSTVVATVGLLREFCMTPCWTVLHRAHSLQRAPRLSG